MFFWSWHGKIPKGKEINHKDGNKQNNSPTNLEAMTPKENMRHAIKSGLWNHMGENHSSAILTQKEVNWIRKTHYAKKFSIEKLANRFGVSLSCINGIVQGYKWNPGRLTKLELIEEYS